MKVGRSRAGVKNKVEAGLPSGEEKEGKKATELTSESGPGKMFNLNGTGPGYRGDDGLGREHRNGDGGSDIRCGTVR